MNTAKWVALRWSLGLLAVFCGFVYFSRVPNAKDIQIQNLRNQNTRLTSDIRLLRHAVGSMRHDLDRLKEDVRQNEERHRKALAESSRPE